MAQTFERATNLLSYYKSHQSVLDILSDELSYSLLFDNIHPSMVDHALSTVGLTTLPSYFLLIQIDGYNQTAPQLEITKEFFQKSSIVSLIRDLLCRQGLDGFAANMVALDKVVCYLCLRDEVDTSFFHNFIADIRAITTVYTLSVAVSPRCCRLTDYPRAYTDMEQMLAKSFYGRGCTYIPGPEVPRDDPQTSVSQYCTRIQAAISRNARAQVAAVTDELFSHIRRCRIPAQEVKSQLIRMIFHLEDFLLGIGVSHTDAVAQSNELIEAVTSSEFLEDIQTLLQRYYAWVFHQFSESNPDPLFQFELSIRLFIQSNYANPIHTADVAGLYHYSSGHFIELFRKCFDTTFTDYVNEYRIQKSKELLCNTDMTIQEIALAVGYTSGSYFSRIFSRLCGQTALSYRQAGNSLFN